MVTEFTSILMGVGMSGDEAVSWINAIRPIFMDYAKVKQYLEKIAFDFSMNHLLDSPADYAGKKAEDFIGFDEDFGALMISFWSAPEEAE